jgi:hypothetical protein
MSGFGEALAKGLKSVTKDFTKAKHRAQGRPLSQRQLNEQRAYEKRKKRDTIKKAAYAVMVEAYNLVSDNGRLPANARQIMYAARPRVLNITGGKCWEKSEYFTQHLLPNYIEEHPDETETWDVVFDARGHLHEPHSDFQLGLGTLEVRNYITSWRGSASDQVGAMGIESKWPSRGPANRYKYALFIEKEGFNPLIERSKIRERFDIMAFSSKGMSVTAARRLVDALSAKGGDDPGGA